MKLVYRIAIAITLAITLGFFSISVWASYKPESGTETPLPTGTEIKKPPVVQPVPMWPTIQIFGDPSLDDRILDIAVSTGGSLYAAGRTNGALGRQNPTNSEDALVVKFFPNGAKGWTRQLGTDNYIEWAYGTAVDVDENVYVVMFSNSDVFEGHSNQGNPGTQDAYLVKFDKDGNKLWVSQLPDQSQSNDFVTAVAIDNAGSIYTAGYYLNAGGYYNTFCYRFLPTGTRDPSLNIVFGGSTNNVVAYGLIVDSFDGIWISGYSDDDAFIARFLSDGREDWTQYLGESGYADIGWKIAKDNNDYVYMTGYTSSPVFDGNVTAGGYDIFVVKYHYNWESNIVSKVWSTVYGTDTDDYARGIAVDEKQGYVYVAGSTYGELGGEHNAGGADASLTQFNADGNALWTRLFGTSNDDSVRGAAISYDLNTPPHMWNEPGPVRIFVGGGANQVGNANGDALAMRYDEDGNLH